MSDLTTTEETIRGTGGVVPDAVAAPAIPDAGGSLGSDAWRALRRNPLFVCSGVLILLVVIVAVAPGLFTDVDPRSCHLELSQQPPSATAWFGYDVQGCDVFARTIYGARASVIVAGLAVISTICIGGVLGVTAGFFRGWVDTLVSRWTDIVLGLPLLLGSTVILATFSKENQGETASIVKVVAALALLGWPTISRVMRSMSMQITQREFVAAARALGAGNRRLIFRHVLPNALGPVIVVATIDLGGYVTAEATLSFLGIGLQPPAISWGIAISDAQNYLRSAPHMLIFPGLFLSLTVLSFIMLGDAIRDALDPTER